MILFGVRSPIVVEYEESLRRLGRSIVCAVSVKGTPRLIDRAHLVDFADFVASSGEEFIAPAFAPLRRRELWAQATALGLEPCEPLIDPTAITPHNLRVGSGSFVNAGVVIGAMSFLGEGVLVNRAASLGHHTVLGDFVSIGPGVTLAGNVQVGAGSVIGAGAVLLPNVRIGAGSIVSAGSLVRKHVPDATLVVGNPALPRPFIPARSSLAVEDGE